MQFYLKVFVCWLGFFWAFELRCELHLVALLGTRHHYESYLQPNAIIFHRKLPVILEIRFVQYFSFCIRNWYLRSWSIKESGPTPFWILYSFHII